MENKKLTAVEWLAEQMLHPDNFNPYIEQAKVMERDQIIDAYLQGSFNWERQGATQFYNETYGGDK
jgi:Leu/Phe-tRNA-protein transferase